MSVTSSTTLPSLPSPPTPVHNQLISLIDSSAPTKIKNSYHLYEKDHVLYACTLNQTNLERNNNKFYLMQLLKSNKVDTYGLYTRGGRVGYNGTPSFDIFIKLEDAIAEWESRFLEKTGFRWEDRDNTVPQPGKYDCIAMTYTDEFKEAVAPKGADGAGGAGAGAGAGGAAAEVKKLLDAQTERLMRLIWDPNMFKDAMAAVKIDTQRMPLGKISKKQIDKAYDLLNKISLAVDNKATTEKEFLMLSSQFYTIVPYACGMSTPPAIRDESAVKEKLEQLKLLDELIIAQDKMGSSGSGDPTLDSKYLSLNCNIQALSDPAMGNMIKEYIDNTCGSTHSYRMKLHQIYEVRRLGEVERFSKFNTMHNRQLLWHGSRVANFVGILSQGLRINPANVIRTGSMFGNGLYFANACTKSAGYMAATENGLILLCEVALGNTYDLYQSQPRCVLPAGKNSTWGKGLYTPDRAGYKTLADGVVVPMGKLVANAVQRGNTYALNYDEFIVYDADQVRIRYLCLVDLS
jgi:poly [ADP-ribose] polymerase